MTILEKISLFDNAIGWVFEHCRDITSYVYALDVIGFTREQAIEEIKDCSYGEENELRAQAIEEVYGEENCPTRFIAIKIKNYKLNCSKFLEDLAMNGYTYNTDGENILFVAYEECEAVIHMLAELSIEYEIL